MLRRFEYDIMQPVVDRSGIFVYYAAKTSFFSRVAHFRLDLRTNLVTNITAVGSPTTGQDVDPNLSATGKSVLFVRNPAGRGAEIALMNTNGTDRRAITSLTYHNTDPSPSPDGRRFVTASYRGYGKRSQANPAVPSSTGIPEYYHLVVQDLRRGAAQTVLTGGVNCTIRVPLNACGVQEMSAFVPRFTPDGRSISFTGARDYRRTCLCVIDVDRSDPRVLFESADVALDWHSWAQPAGYPTSTAHIGKAYSTELLVVLSGPDKVKRLAVGYPDLATRTYIPLPSGLQPIEARWGPGRRTIVFTANVRVGTRKAPHPAPPRGSTRKVHALPKGAARTSATVAERQVFLLNRAERPGPAADRPVDRGLAGRAARRGRPRQLPAPGLPGRQGRSTSPTSRPGPASRSCCASTSTTGAVRNLTRPATTVVRKDADPVLSSGGTRLVFTRSEGGTRDLFVMDAATGGNLTRLRNDATSAAAPAWAPDNSYLLYTSIRNGRLGHRPGPTDRHHEGRRPGGGQRGPEVGVRGHRVAERILEPLPGSDVEGDPDLHQTRPGNEHRAGAAGPGEQRALGRLEVSRVTADLATVVVNWNTVGLLDECLASIFAATPASLHNEVVVVDNGSTDGSVEHLRRHWPDVRLIVNPDNQGFCRANNAAVRATDAPLLLLVNTDARLQPDNIAGLLRYFRDDPQAAVVGPRLTYADGTFQRWTAGRLPGLRSLAAFLLGLDRVGPWRGAGHYLGADTGEAFRPEWVSSAVMAVRRSALEEVGLLDEDIFVYMDDVDLCAAGDGRRLARLVRRRDHRRALHGRIVHAGHRPGVARGVAGPQPVVRPPPRRGGRPGPARGRGARLRRPGAAALRRGRPPPARARGPAGMPTPATYASPWSRSMPESAGSAGHRSRSCPPARLRRGPRSARLRDAGPCAPRRPRPPRRPAHPGAAARPRGRDLRRGGQRDPGRLGRRCLPRRPGADPVIPTASTSTT